LELEDQKFISNTVRTCIGRKDCKVESEAAKLDLMSLEQLHQKGGQRGDKGGGVGEGKLSALTGAESTEVGSQSRPGVISIPAKFLLGEGFPRSKKREVRVLRLDSNRESYQAGAIHSLPLIRVRKVLLQRALTSLSRTYHRPNPVERPRVEAINCC